MYPIARAQARHFYHVINFPSPDAKNIPNFSSRKPFSLHIPSSHTERGRHRSLALCDRGHVSPSSTPTLASGTAQKSPKSKQLPVYHQSCHYVNKGRPRKNRFPINSAKLAISVEKERLHEGFALCQLTRCDILYTGSEMSVGPTFPFFLIYGQE